MSRADVVEAARKWIGTPYVHQASAIGAGTDCLGLLRGVWRDVVGAEPVKIPSYSRDWSEPGGDEALWRAADVHLMAKPVAEAALGDVILFRMRSGTVAKHLGIVSRIGSAPGFIHAYSRHGVIENALSRPWQRRIVARFEFPSRRD